MKRHLLLSILAVTLLVPAAHAQWSATLQSVAIAPSNDHVYYWYSRDGWRVSAGTSNDPFRYRAPQQFETLPRWTLMGTGIDQRDRVHYWWLSNVSGHMMVTIGTSTDPIAHQAKIGITSPAGYFLQDVGISSDNRVYYYWRNRYTYELMNSVGTTSDPVAHRDLQPVSVGNFIQGYHLLHVDIASNDHVYYFWRNFQDHQLYVTSGTSLDPFAYRDVYSANQPN